MLGPGSILNDKNWTPLLNDSYILGGVHGEHEFHLAEDSANAYPSRSRAVAPKEQWQSYFRTHTDAVWDTTRQVPRILARELIGLKTFGYRPQFFQEQLSFGARQSDGATFRIPGRACCSRDHQQESDNRPGDAFTVSIRERSGVKRFMTPRLTAPTRSGVEMRPTLPRILVFPFSSTLTSGPREILAMKPVLRRLRKQLVVHADVEPSGA